MKKSILAVAGLAAVAGIAAPVAGVFATAQTSEVTDNLSVTVGETCSLSRTGGNGALTGEGVINGTWDSSTNKYNVSMAAGNTAQLGVSTIKVVCNDTTNGHSLALAVTSLTKDTDNKIAYTNEAVGTSASGWNITTSAETNLGISSGIVSTASDAATLYGSGTKNKTAVDTSFTATYNVGIKSTQAAGTYTGTAKYTLTYSN